MPPSRKLTSGPGALPVYVQVAEMVAREISSGRLLEGEKLPPERAMCADLGISIGTLRKSLSRLEDQGFLIRRQGSGNYIRQPESSESIYAFFRLELPEGGGLPTGQVLSCVRFEKPADLPPFGRSNEAFRLRRLRALDGIPVALEEIWIDGALAEEIDPDLISQSVYAFYKTKLSIWIERAEDFVSVAPVPDWTVPDFGPKEGDQVGYVERLSWSQHGEIIEYSRNWFDPKKARYCAKLR